MDSPDERLQIAVTNLNRDCLLNPPALELSDATIHTWQFPLTISVVSLDSFTALLSEDERARAARFHFEKDSRRFTVARASVRSILGTYIGKTARDLRFRYANHGKPTLTEVDADICFSVSHSGDLAMLAVSLAHEVGIDVEAIRKDVETDKLAERYFSEQERMSLRALPHAQRVRAFFRCWTCKEAFLKAQGLGLSRSLGSFDVEVDPSRPAHLHATRPDSEEAALWSLQDVPTEENHAAAVVWSGSIHTMKILRCC